MRSWKLALAITMLSGVVVAQAPVPGTFNNTPPQTTQQTNGSGTNGGYIVSPPMISYGDGITPTVVTSQDTVQVTMPQNTSLNGSTVQANNPATVNDNGANNTVNASAKRPFDFIKAPGGDNSPVGGSMADDSVSLGEVARQMRNGKQIAKRTITNADVDALNAKYPGSNPTGDQSGSSSEPMNGNAIAAPNSQPSSAPINNGGGTAGAANSSAPAYAQPSVHSPFAPLDSSARGGDGTKPNAQQGEGIEPRRQSRPAEAAPSSAPSNTPQQQESGAQPQQLPRSSSSLPLLGTLGGLTTLAGILYFKMR